MKIYVNHYSTEGGSSGGFSYHSTERDAVAAIDAMKATLKDDFEVPLEIATPATVTMTKVGVLSFLNRYGGHPDNG